MPVGRRGGMALIALVTAVFALCEPAAAEPLSPTLPAPPLTTATPPAAAPEEEEIQEVKVTAREARYVAPTLRDRLGRIWAPVYLNGKGPFRLVLDTGASNSAVIAEVVGDLGMKSSGAMRLHGVTGSATVPFITVHTFLVGDMEEQSKLLPIVPDALGGADGVLGMESLEGKRIDIDFLNDKISITHSHGTRAPLGYWTIPLVRSANGLLMATAYMGTIRVNAVIDTGGQATVANPALLAALQARHHTGKLVPSSVTGATDDVQAAQDTVVPALTLGPISIQAPYITVSDLQIFERWHMTAQPAMLIGIDTLGLLENLVIDYRRMELQVRTRHNWNREMQ
ncbi:MAG TPA: retropepsin-like aspartic protease [Steroidobacteraceae bacterium]|nr:retropepsin-like aspartic protease [Steroidobacteraceae bacterium]